MESAKEKAIREAWVKLIGEEEFKTMSFDEHGFSKSSYLRLIPDSEYRDSVIQSTLIKGKMHYRPKYLQGIENNAGWNLISEKGNPATEQYVDIFYDGDIFYEILYSKGTYSRSYGYSGETYYEDFKPTHWRETNECKPIY